MTADVQLSFSNNFWGMNDDGYSVLTDKMTNSKRTFDEIKSFYSVRASLHEEFGRKLMKHCKNGMGKEENGTLNELLVSAHKEMEHSAKVHLGVASKLKNRLEVELDNFILEQKERRKLMQGNVDKAFRAKKLNENHLLRQREKYEADYVKLLGLQKQLQSATTTKDEDRLRIKVERTQHEIKIQEQEYRNACIKLADAIETWNRTWKLACDVYQGMEKKRLEFLYYSFSMYINIISTGTSEDQESHERFWKYLDKYDPINDMQSFIKQKRTGNKIPEAEIFVDYNDDPEKRLIKYHEADFELPTELTSTPITPLKPKLTVRNPSSRSNDSEKEDDDDNEKEKEDYQHSQVVPVSHENNEMKYNDEQLHQRQQEEDQKEAFIEPPMPSNKKAERRKSIQSVMKPLPSVSSPSQRPKSSSSSNTISSTLLRRQSSEIQRRGVDGINIPTRTISSSSNTATASASASAAAKRRSTNSMMIKKNTAKNGATEEDIKIDPRAKVVFSIGNNMFDLGHLANESRDDFNRQKKKRDGISRSHRKNQSSVDIDAACNFSYQSLLKDLGVFDSNDDDSNGDMTDYHHVQKTTKNDNNNKKKKQVAQGGVAKDGTFIKDEKAILNEISPEPTTTNYYTENYYHHHQQQQQQPSSDAYISNDRYYQQQPSGYTRPVSNGQDILFWGQAIADWYSNDPEQLQFTRGTWLAITEARADGWYYATKYDSRLNTFTNEKGYVAQNYMQIV